MPSNLQRVTTDSRHNDFHEFATPEYATDILVPYLKEKGFQHVWECACGLGHITEVLKRNGFNVFQSDIKSFKENKGDVHQIDFTKYFEIPEKSIDCIVTNPPFNIKDDFIEQCYYHGLPFALLLPLKALGAKRRISMYKKYGIQLLIPDSRINYIYYEDKHDNWFHSSWFCWGILPKTIIFTEMDTHDKHTGQTRFC